MAQSFTFPTHLGDVVGKLFGAALPDCPGGPAGGTNFVLCVQGKSANHDVVTEWEHTAQELAAAGWCVILPNLHTNERTKPGTLPAEEVAKILQSALDHNGVKQPVCLLGKSWGGGQATRFAAAFPEKVQRLVLVAPSLDDPTAVAHLSTTVRVRLFWALDDNVVPPERAAVYRDGIDASRLVFTTVKTGGHRILDEYSASIVSFLA